MDAANSLSNPALRDGGRTAIQGQDMDTEPKSTKDVSIKRILIVAALLGLGGFLLVGLPQYFPDHADIIARLVATLAFAVVIVVVHDNVSASRRSDRDRTTASVTGRYATATRILVVWVILFLVNTLFFSI